MKKAAWIPLIGVVVEFVNVFTGEIYLSDLSNFPRFFWSMVWHGVWIGVALSMIFK